MEKIKDIFYNGMNPVNENLIRTIIIDWSEHSKGILNIARNLEPNFEVTEDNKAILKQLLLYFTGSKESHLDLNKGLFLVGGIGTGKSLLFDVFKIYTAEILRINSFQYHFANEIINNVNINGIEKLELYNFNNGFPITCYIDDIASKTEKIKHYGTEINVIEQLLNIRYQVFNRFRKLTHISSNKYPAEMKEIYDLRIVDRFKEMFNIIEINGKSFRK